MEIRSKQKNDKHEPTLEENILYIIEFVNFSSSYTGFGGMAQKEQKSTDVEDLENQKQLLEWLKASYSKHDLADVLLMAEDQSIPCHKVILSSTSLFLREEFAQKLRE